MKNKLAFISLLGLATLGSGCASIVTGHEQSVSIDTQQKGIKIKLANCKLQNDKGTWFVTTPGSTTVRRSYNPMTIVCEKDGHEKGILKVESSTKAMAFGNVVFGGVIGAGVDMATGAAYDYPPLITVEMGQSGEIKRKEPEQKTTDNKQAKKEDSNNTESN